MSARNSLAAKAARRTERTRGAPAPAPVPWDGVVSQAEIAAAVQEVVTREAWRLYGMIPEQLCLSYATAGAMLAGLATGRRYALQIGGFAVHDFWNKAIWSYGPGWRLPGLDPPELEYHTWFSAVPPGTDPEVLWAMPPWAQVCDLSLAYFTDTAKAMASCGRPLVPGWCWDTRLAVRERLGIEYRPDHGLTMRILGRTFSEGGANHLWLAHACRMAAARLGFRTAGLVPLAPGSFLVGHRSPEMVPR